MTLPIAPLSRRELLLPAFAGLGCAALSAIPAQAHGTAGADVAAGLAHPLLGLDHLLLWLGLGAVGSMAGRRWILWGAAGGVLGVVLGSLGVTLPLAEPLAGLAVTVMGLLLLISRGSTQTALPLGVLVAGCCATHGLLHGAEGSGGAAGGWACCWARWPSWPPVALPSRCWHGTGRPGWPWAWPRWGWCSQGSP